MSSWQVVCADVVHWAENYKGPPFMACLCDPPYHLGPNGFMNKSWDSAKSGISFQPETWAALAQHLHPGAWVMAFASSRGWHRLAVAIEDAGLIIQPSIFGWATGQSFPKATRIDTQIDKAGGDVQAWQRFADAYAKVVQASELTHSDIDRHLGIKSSSCYWVRTDERGGLPPRRHWTKIQGLLGLDPKLEKLYDEAEREVVGRNKPIPSAGIYGEFEGNDITIPATDLARAWVGHRYGGQVLKDALNPIICAQKPWVGKRLDCIVDSGAGALWIEGARVSNSAQAGKIQQTVRGVASEQGDGVTLEDGSFLEWCQCDHA